MNSLPNLAPPSLGWVTVVIAIAVALCRVLDELWSWFSL